MSFQNLPIRLKVLLVMMLTSSAVLGVTSAAFLLYEWTAFRQAMSSSLVTLGQIVAANSSSTLALKNEREAQQILTALRAEPNIVQAALYDENGKLFATYPKNQSLANFPTNPQKDGYEFGKSHLVLFQSVLQDGRRLGTLYLMSDLQAIYDRFRLYGGIVALVMAVCFMVALLISLSLERRISDPIMALAAAAKIVSERKDYSIQAPQAGRDEVGYLTDTFNEMVVQIREREAALKDKEQSLRLTLEGSQTGTWDWDLASAKIRLDDYTYPLFGLAPGHFGGTSEDFLALAHPEDRPALAESLSRTRTDGAPLHAEFRALWPNGSIHHMVVRGRAFRDSKGELVQVRAVAIDVTQIKQAEEAVRASEERYRSLVAATTSVVWTTDSEGAFVSPQTSWEAYTGQTWHQHAGSGWANALHPDDREAIKSAWIRALHHRGLFEAEGRLWHAGSQSYRQFQGRAVPIVTPTGAVREWVGTVTDVEDQKAAEREIVRLNEELEERVLDRTAELAAANKELEAFTYSVSHDLRAPLRHIDSYGRILEQEFADHLPAEAQDFLKRIRQGIQKMGRLIDDLLNLARVSRQGLTRRPASLNTIVEEVIVDLRAETQNREIEWRVTSLPLLECDPGLIKQVFANLLANAIKYTRPRSKAIIEVGQSQEKNELVIFVRDNGVGFNMKFAGKLFGVFQRLHRADEFEGTGVGLATVERIIRQHGGRVWGQAELDKGATFYFTLPNKRATSVAAPFMKREEIEILQ